MRFSACRILFGFAAFYSPQFTSQQDNLEFDIVVDQSRK